jgi:hypothetical protein
MRIKYEIQGNWFSRPIAPELLLELLSEKGGDIKADREDKSYAK